MATEKKELRNKQNQSINRLLGAILGTIIFGFLVYELIELGSLKELGILKSILLFVWPILVPVLIWRYRKEERQLKEHEEEVK